MRTLEVLNRINQKQIPREKMVGIISGNNFRRRRSFQKGFPSWLKKWKLGDIFSTYCNETSIAGFKYISEDHRPWHERILWMVGIAVGFVVCIILACNAWSGWKKAPVIVTMGESLQPIWKVPFPAVTICPYSRIHFAQLNITEYLLKYDSLNVAQKQILADCTIQCINPLPSIEPKRPSIAIDYLESVALPLDNVITRVMFNEHRTRTNVFQPLLTEAGLCRTFNMLPNEVLFTNNTFHSSRNYLHYENVNIQWIMGEGYSSSARGNAYPYRSLGSGRVEGLSVVLQAFSWDMEYFCSGSFEGFQVTLHNPWEFPRMSKSSFFVPLGRMVEVAVTPYTMLTSDELRRSYSPAQRQCYFPDERRLRFFKHYTRSNCEFECLANVTFHMCQCVAFYMPRELETLICTDIHDNCVSKAEYMFQLLRSGLKDDLNIFNATEDEMEALGFKCNCLQTCLSVKYRAERSSTPAKVKKYLIELTKNLPADEREIIEKVHLSFLMIFFKESQFLPLRRMELHGIGTFIANCGGLLGLCLGMSFLSILELLYWLLVRPFRRSKKVAPQPVEIITLTLPALYKKKVQH